MSYSQNEKDKFFEAVDSLKKYRRAEIVDESGKDLVDALYTDLLPNEQILKTCLTDNTTFLIGRKGTGKSTIFLKLQREYRKRNDVLSCYIDTKTIFESSQTEFLGIEHFGEVMPNEALKQYILERSFLQSILRSLTEEIQERSEGLLGKIKNFLGIGEAQIVKEKLRELTSSINNNELLKKIEIPSLQQITVARKSFTERSNETALNENDSIGGKVQRAEVEMEASLSSNKMNKSSRKNISELEEQFSNVFLKVFQIKNFISQLREVLSTLRIRSLVVLLDDFSEIPDHSMRIFVDVILSPLNNWSQDFIKFKVAAYPNRIYYGKIDQGKIDKINLDFYNLYSTRVDRSVMEDKALNFTKRLIEKRVKYFTNQPVELFFDIRKESIEEYYELIFQISMNVPRIIGYILYYCYESKIAYGNSINRAALTDAAEKYYELAIEPFFQSTTYSLKSIDEKISILQMRELLNGNLEKLFQERLKLRLL
ncbi:hypothetical protein [Egbenema bharatensis]|uniref:hypothetical protein n=1 Tax=Egbenema bharatensis TaxID=3463334 RepID=UPI003A8A0595